ncbi:hypothetical protein ORV05_21760 [Amycolatopsis cynarae]|uniref:Uncharacterized protein n=1 Tax=Amycolatopsis cynarae TaxID=2995223 RepID=A0ABY7AUJ5_9PSEU|nr:hypothetical protein [Amycolatopsis sp. HUAS 11-8]WAL63626.1 hypothetical protein ORV05_21760 [Amycolatopsis sp. HUAS 11-8]
MSEKKKRPVTPEPPLPPDFPRLHHPDLGLENTKDVDEPPNRDEVEPPGRGETPQEAAIPEPPD